jgi:hypothetical protein
MASRRTISYIGLWALIMPWLGFSWGTKTVLFSLTGVLLLFIGNRHYNSEKKKNKPAAPLEPEIESKPLLKEEPASTPVSTYKPIPEYMTTSSSSASYTEKKFEYTEPSSDFVFESKEEPMVFNTTIKSTVETGDNVESVKPKTRKRIKIEMPVRAKRTSPKPITLDSLNSDYGEEQI